MIRHAKRSVKRSDRKHKNTLSNNMQFNYNKSESKVFAHELGNKIDNTKVQFQFSTMPMHSNQKNIGMLYSDARIIEQEDKYDVLQTLTYAFNGSDPKFPKGTLTLRIFFENANKSIFPPDNAYTAHIISGSDAYLNATGTVAINVKNDERNATIHFTHI